MGNRLFFVAPDQKVQEMNEGFFELESKLQEIVEKNPDLLSRGWDNQPRKLYLISREQEVFADADEGNMFSLDHLLVDSEGVPILVEVKRSTDTRIRREVVAQMLDYACRASSWSIEKLKASFCKNNADRPEAAPLFDDEEFWNRVSANLGAEHFRLVFVADRIPETLRILIEFLDRTMKEIEVYGVELKPYQTSDGMMLLSSNIIGNSLNVRQKPTYPARGETIWTEDAFLSRIQDMLGAEAADTAAELISRSPMLGLIGSFGKGEVLANYMAKKADITVFQIGQAYGNFFVLLTYKEIQKLAGCRERGLDELRDSIFKIFPPEVDLHSIQKETGAWIPLKTLSNHRLIDPFCELIRSFL